MPAGRPSLGPKHARKVEASPSARRRLELILASLSGETTIAAACAELGINEARFHVIRKQALQAAADRLEPQPTGRPPRREDSAGQRIAELEAELKRKSVELQAAEIRAELAVAMPGVLQQSAQKKTRANRTRARARRCPPRRHGQSRKQG